MPNYAIPSPTGMNQWQSFYRDRYAGLPDLSKLAFSFNPDVGFEDWLSVLQPSNAYDQALRRLYGTLFNRYNAYTATSPAGSNTSWGDYLGSLDVDRELARYGPTFRGEGNNKFNRPARFISF